MTEDDLILRIKDLAPLIEENAALAERQRKPVDAVMQAIEETQVYRYFVPKRFGGFEFSVEGFMQLGMIMGEACLSTAWVTMFCVEHNWILAQFNRQAQQEIFGRQPYVIAPGMFPPMGQAKPVDGGFRITGRWEWGTGVMHADWVLVGARTEGGDPQQPEICIYAIPLEQVSVIDTWQTAGMVGTGSNDVQADDVFVPGHMRQDLNQIRDGGSSGGTWHESPLYRMPMLPFLALTAAAPAVGAARKAVNLFQHRLSERVVYGTTDKQRMRPVSQARLGRVAAEIAATERHLLALASEAYATAVRGTVSSLLERAALKLQVANVVHQARNVVREVVEASGAHAHFLDNPLQRLQRDINTLSCHTVFDLDVGSEVLGRLLLGLTPNSQV